MSSPVPFCPSEDQLNGRMYCSDSAREEEGQSIAKQRLPRPIPLCQTGCDSATRLRSWLNPSVALDRKSAFYGGKCDYEQGSWSVSLELQR